MYECFHCGARAVIWDSDFMFDECGYEGEGLVHCGAEIEYRIPLEDEDDPQDP